MPIDILIVKVNQSDARLLRELLLEANQGAHPHAVTDGAAAVESTEEAFCCPDFRDTTGAL
jgi:hypothetical protein